MRNYLILLFVLCTTFAPPAFAGAWLRKKGATFTSISFTTNWYRETGQTTYLEYGLLDDLTIGVDVGMGLDRLGVQSGHGTAFMRRPLDWGNQPNVWAFDVGIGASWTGPTIVPHIKTGLSWGRGMTLRGQSGWMAVDAAVKWDLGSGAHVAKLDSTLGLNFTPETTGMVQVFVTRGLRETYGIFAPSLIYQPGKSKFRIQIGLESPFENTDDTAVKFGVWREF